MSIRMLINSYFISRPPLYSIFYFNILFQFIVILKYVLVQIIKRVVSTNTWETAENRIQDSGLLFTNFISLRNAYQHETRCCEAALENQPHPWDGMSTWTGAKSRGKARGRFLSASPRASVSSQHVTGAQCLWINIFPYRLWCRTSNWTNLVSASPKCPCSDSRTLRHPPSLYLLNAT